MNDKRNNNDGNRSSPLSLVPLDEEPKNICPKCGYKNSSGHLVEKYNGMDECPKCGIIPEKYHQYHQKKNYREEPANLKHKSVEAIAKYRNRRSTRKTVLVPTIILIFSVLGILNHFKNENLKERQLLEEQQSLRERQSLFRKAYYDACRGYHPDSSIIGQAPVDAAASRFWFERKSYQGIIYDFNLPDDLKATSPERFNLAVCVDRQIITLGDCSYGSYGENSIIIKKLQTSWFVTIYDTRTAQIVAQKTFMGDTTECPFIIALEKLDKLRRLPKPPDTGQIISWLRHNPQFSSYWGKKNSGQKIPDDSSYNPGINRDDPLHRQ